MIHDIEKKKWSTQSATQSADNNVKRDMSQNRKLYMTRRYRFRLSGRSSVHCDIPDRRHRHMQATVATVDT